MHYLEQFPSDAKTLTLYELKAPEMMGFHFLPQCIDFYFPQNVSLTFPLEGDRNKALLNASTYSEETYNWTAMFYCY